MGVGDDSNDLSLREIGREREREGGADGECELVMMCTLRAVD